MLEHFACFYTLLILMVINTTSCLCGKAITMCNYGLGSETFVTSRVASQKSSHPLIAVKLKVYYRVVNSLEHQATRHNILFSRQRFADFSPSPRLENHLLSNVNYCIHSRNKGQVQFWESLLPFGPFDI